MATKLTLVKERKIIAVYKYLIYNQNNEWNTMQTCMTVWYPENSSDIARLVYDWTRDNTSKSVMLPETKQFVFENSDKPDGYDAQDVWEYWKTTAEYLRIKTAREERRNK